MRPYSIYQSKLWATQLSLKQQSDSIDKLSKAIATARVDLNPHQVDAALFAVRSPLSKGAILADEVGLGKTIEAGIVISQKWAERKRKILIIAPATLRKQWQQEMLDKFSIPSTILENASYKHLKKNRSLFDGKSITICSYNFAAGKCEEIVEIDWDLVVIDEAHRLRNVYKPNNKMANAIAKAVQDSPKLLLTATPLQNSLLELFGLVSIIDPHVFGDITSFKEQYIKGVNENLRNIRLKERIQPFCQRTLRKQVLEYIKFTQRVAMTEEFIPGPEEQRLYDLVSAYLQKDKLHALPRSQRTLMTLVLRKLLASSSYAIASTLQKLVSRLENASANQDMLEMMEDEFDGIDEMADEFDEEDTESSDPKLSPEELLELKLELSEIKEYANLASSIKDNAKGKALLRVLKTAFNKLQEIGADRKALIFTESRRTQLYLVELLTKEGYADQLCVINGSNNDQQSKAIYQEWLQKHQGSDRISGSKSADMKAALVEHFKNKATILIATESAAEGVNLQFCSLVVNYDLPWNPQRVEQRIGRCHRYGQKFDVVVVNFLNKKNAADQRVFQLLSEKFKLFDGVFGASDEVLGTIENGVDIEKRIAAVYQVCRTADEIQLAFDELQTELDDQIKLALETTRVKLLENFDEEVNARLRISHDQTKTLLDKRGHQLLMLAKSELNLNAIFEDNKNIFTLEKQPIRCSAPLGRYSLDWRKADRDDEHFFSENSNLAEWVINEANARPTLDLEEINLEYKSSPFKISALEPFLGSKGWIKAEKVTITSVEDEEFLLLNVITDSGEVLDDDLSQKLLSLGCSSVKPLIKKDLPEGFEASIEDKRNLITQSLDHRNARYFDEETVKLDAWSDDLKFGLEAELKQIDKEIKEAKKQATASSSLSEKLEQQKLVRSLENQRNLKRKNLYEAQDKIDVNRDELIKKIEKQLQCSTKSENLFLIRWVLN